jgi:hypothetical protein
MLSDPYLWLLDPDPEGSKTRGSGGIRIPIRIQIRNTANLIEFFESNLIESYLYVTSIGSANRQRFPDLPGSGFFPNQITNWTAFKYKHVCLCTKYRKHFTLLYYSSVQYGRYVVPCLTDNLTLPSTPSTTRIINIKYTVIAQRRFGCISLIEIWLYCADPESKRIRERIGNVVHFASNYLGT